MLVGWLATASVRIAAAQDPLPSLRFNGIVLSGSLRARVENWRWFSAPPAASEYTYGAAVLRLRLGRETKRLEWQAEGSFPVFMGLPKNAVGPETAGPLGYGGDYYLVNQTSNIAAAVLRQAFVGAKALDGKWRIRFGRFEFGDGAESVPPDPDLAALKAERVNQRLIGVFNYALRSFDGADFNYRHGTSNVRVVAARLTEGSFQLRALREIDAELAYGAYTRSFSRGGAQSEARFFVLAYQDRRDALKVDNRPSGDREQDRRPIRLITPGAHFIHEKRIGPGMADVVLWGAGQFGRWGAQRHLATEITAEGGYRFSGKGQLGVRGGYFRSSGDRDPNDREHHTFFQVLSSPRAYARFPFYVLMNVSDVFLQFRAAPRKKMALRIELHSVRLTSAHDLWYDGGGAFQSGSFGYLGRPSGGKGGIGAFCDLSADYAVSTSTTFSVYGGAARGGAVPESVYPAGGTKPVASLFSAELVRRF